MTSSTPSTSPPCWSHLVTTNNPVHNSTSAMTVDDDARGKIIIALAIVRLCLAIFGCIANVVAAVVLTNRKLWSPTSMLLLSLVIYDAFYLVLVIPVGATSISVNLHFTAARYSTLRTIMALCFPLRNMAQMASTYTTLTVTVERYLVILLPLKASSMWTYGKTRRAIIGVLLFSVIFNLPRCFDSILSNPSPTSASSSAGSLSEPSARRDGRDSLLLGNLSSSSSSSPFSSSSSSSSSSSLGWGERRLQESAYLGLVPHGASSGGSDVTGTGNSSCVSMRDDVSKAYDVSNAKRWNLSQPLSPTGNLTSAGREQSGAGEREGGGGGGGGGVSDGLNYFYRVVYQFYLTVIFLYLIPYTLIPVLNLQLVMALRRRREETRRISVKNEHRLNGLGGSSSPTDKEEGLTYIVFGITFCYFVCCILPTVYMISAIASDTSSDQTSIFIFNAGETTLVINAATDFFFYCLLGRKFRRVFMRTFCPQRYLKKTKVLTMRTTVSYNSV